MISRSPRWASAATEVARSPAATPERQSIVVGEIGYEGHHGDHYEDFQRCALAGHVEWCSRTHYGRSKSA